MSEMIERVASAIWALNDDTDCRVYDDLAPHAKAQADAMARAAIKAMREPTEAMVNAAMLPASEADREAYRPQHWIWEKMIDEALK